MNDMTLEEAKVIAVQGENAPIGKVVIALDRLFLEIRRIEDERGLNLFAESKL